LDGSRAPLYSVRSIDGSRPQRRQDDSKVPTGAAQAGTFGARDPKTGRPQPPNGPTRRQWLLSAGAALAGGPALAQSGGKAYPSRPIRLIVPFPPGGPVDVVGRLTAEVLGKALKQPVVVDNRPGSGGSLGTDLVAKAEPDGLTLGIGPISSLSISPAMGLKLPYKVDSDFSFITMLAKVVGAIVAHPDAPFNDLAQMIAYAKARPGQLSFASSGQGTSSHLAGEYLAQRAGIEMVHVPYKGTGPAIQDLLGGQVPIYFETSLAGAAPLVAGKRLKAIAITGSSGSALLPGVRTVAEQGFPGFDVSPWMGLIGPRGLPPEVVATLHAALITGLQAPEVTSRLAALGGLPETSTPEQFRAFVARDTQHWATLIRQARLRFD
jgi:tripartite-type tricarboxylate transporter receptor subunit TctC